jgi:hypothetical protein
MCSNGGKASGVARRRKKSLREAADLYLSLPFRDCRKLRAMVRDGLDPNEIDNQMAVIVGLAKMAQMGDSKSAKLLFELLDESGADKMPVADDGFLDALKEEAADVWQDD